eukprot:GHVQ01012932.1.p1 GENE.GHVQ01012932.1~~GHVQ01012932.1.p1  ORF type:complete len:189 (+),score=27.80 GHVQ01012932.1:79-645(+)
MKQVSFMLIIWLSVVAVAVGDELCVLYSELLQNGAQPHSSPPTTQDCSMANLEALKKNDVIGDVVKDSSFNPSVTLKVRYASKELHHDKPSEMTIAETQHAPHVESTLPAGTKYVLVMTDPDAPSRKTPSKGEWCHWVVSGISTGGGDLGQGYQNSKQLLFRKIFVASAGVVAVAMYGCCLETLYVFS